VISQDNANLFWDNTNKRLGIGTTSPVSALNIRGFSGGTGGDPLSGYTRNLVIGGPYNQPYNSGNATLLEIRDYSNDPGDNVYPIFVCDENSNIDFFLKAGNTNSNVSAIAYFGVGYVGIGIQNPSERLHVIGNVRIGDAYKLLWSDVNLYRGDADVLKTDDSFDALALRIGGTEVISSSRILYNVTPRLSSIQNTAGQTVLEFG
jgi:hypothetical protein